MSNRLEKIENILTTNTVLIDWFKPIVEALEKVRFSGNKFHTLSMPMHILQNCIRQLNASKTLREHLQTLFHIDDMAEGIPLARSTYSDALSSTSRLKILEEVVDLVAEASNQSLPDRLSGIAGLKGRDTYALDATYQEESSRFKRVTPSEGGTDSSKGHLHLTAFNLRSGLPVNTGIDTSSISEIRFVKDCWKGEHLTKIKNSLWIVDRGFIDAEYWDGRKNHYQVTVITRMKSNLNYKVISKSKVTCSNKKQGIKTDYRIQLESSKEEWRLVAYKSDSGEYYEYLTNDFSLTPGVVAFLYHRRWDEEKYFDNYKNDMANAKAWGKSNIAIQQQAIIGMLTFILTRLFSEKHANKFCLPMDGSTQKRKHKKKVEKYLEGITRDQFRAFHTNLSKVTKQVWRFLKDCMLKKSSHGIYERQLRPMMSGYL